jgi:hypothetical protein
MRTVTKPALVLGLVLSLIIPGIGRAQSGESDLRLYGYLQASFYQENHTKGNETNSNTFTVQQLDILLHKDLNKNWSAFVDLLFTNNYSTFRNAGNLNLEQAWVRYRRNHYLNVKAGLLIPRFNYLNEIKNKMPVLPYIIRPLAYETSFQEDIPIEEFVPQRAYLQVYGFAPGGEYKVEYAGYIGNSPNVNRDRAFGQTGLDTTSTFLVGGRIGIRHANFQTGVSMTHDQVDYLDGVLPDTLSPPLTFSEVSRVRFGADALAEYANFRVTGEYISVRYDEDNPNIKNDKEFFYGTLGYRFAEKLFIFGSYWDFKQYFTLRDTSGFHFAVAKIRVPNAGVSYQMSDRIVFKGATARVNQKINYPGFGERVFWFFTTSVSVTF